MIMSFGWAPIATLAPRPVSDLLCDPRLPQSAAVRHPDIRVKHCAYVRNVATLLNPRGFKAVSHKYSVTVARHAPAVVAVPSTVHYPAHYKVKIYYFRWLLKMLINSSH
jgi:hypothetical protein